MQNNLLYESCCKAHTIPLNKNISQIYILIKLTQQEHTSRQAIINQKPKEAIGMKNIKTANCDKKKTTMIFTNQIPTLKTLSLF